MECDKILEKLCDEISEDINSELCQQIKEHLKTCDKCRAELTSMRNAVNLFRCLDEKEVPSNIHKRLLTLLNLPESQA